MKFSINKTKTATITLVLVLTIAATLTFLPTVNAVLRDVDTYAGITVSPDPIGVGQPVQVIMFLSYLPPSEGYEFQQVVGEPYGITTGGWKGYVLTITKPDGTTTTMGPYESDPSGMYQVSYVPATTGTYYFQFTFPGQTEIDRVWGGSPGAHFLYNAYFLPSTSEKHDVTVQQEPITGWQETPRPWGEYWDRPIEGQNREWNVLGGPWLQSSYNATGAFNPYTQAPKTAHIVWTKLMSPLAGLIGGEYGSLEFQRQTGFSLRCIMGGRVYYNGPTTPDGKNQLYCIDIRTGENIWEDPAPISISQGQILNYRSLQTKAEVPYLWSFGGTYRQYDAQTGRLLVEYTGARSGTAIMEPPNPTVVPGTELGGAAGGGEIMVYMTGNNGTHDWVACWNSTLAMYSYAMDSHFIKLPPSPWPWENGLQWNVTFPYTQAGPTMGISGQPRPGSLSIRTISQDLLICSKNPLYDNDTGVASRPIIAIDTKTGQRLYYKNLTVITYDSYPWSFNGDLGYGKLIMVDHNTLTVDAYDAYTGNYLWTAAPFKNDFAMMSGGASMTFAYDKIFLAGYDGYMHCIDPDTGTVEWSTISKPGGLEMPEMGYPMSTPTVADGRLYASTSKAYETEPLYRGHELYCFDAFTGDKVWNILGQYRSMAIADAHLIATNNYDSQIYCFGKGQTATTVSAPDTAVPRGESVLIQGTVTDQSPGAEGTPCIADADMTEWMEYLYMQKPCPTDLTGVPVYLTAFASDGSMIDLGYVISDEFGYFQKAWNPPDEGNYKIMATMLTTDSYYTSYDETGLLVGPQMAAGATIEPEPTEPIPTEPIPTEPIPTEPIPTEPEPTEPEPTEPEPTEPTEAPFITTEIAIIAAVAIAVVIGIAAYWVLRKRK